MCTVSTEQDCYELKCLPEVWQTVFFVFFGGVVKDCRVGLSGRLWCGWIMCVEELLLACMGDWTPHWRLQVCGECMPDSEPSWGSLSSPCRSAALCLGGGQTPAPSAPPAAPPPGTPLTSAPAPANPEPCCCACTHQVLSGSNRKSHSERKEITESIISMQHPVV